MKLSIVVTNYNYAHFLEGAVSSLFQNKSLDSFEVLLVDDGSTDKSHEIIDKLSCQFPTLRVFKHEKNLGQDQAFETAFKHIRGEYIHPFAADDVMLPGTIDTMLDYFQKYPQISVFCSDNCFFNKSDPHPILEVSKLLNTSRFYFFSPKTVYKLFAHTEFWIPGHTIFAKTETYLKYTPFDKNLRFLFDWHVNHLLALDKGVGYIPKAISAQRKHSSSFGAIVSLEKKAEVWRYLFSLLEKKPLENQLLYRSGIFRMFGLKPIYKELLRTPHYWKYLIPMLRKIVEKKMRLINRNENLILKECSYSPHE